MTHNVEEKYWGDNDPDDEAFDEWDEDSGDDEPTVPCPYCRREIPEDVAQCPYCEHYISALDAPPAPKPWWLILGVAVCLYMVYRWTFG